MKEVVLDTETTGISVKDGHIELLKLDVLNLKTLFLQIINFIVI